MIRVLMLEDVRGGERLGKRISRANLRSILPPGLFLKPEPVNENAGQDCRRQLALPSHFSGGDSQICWVCRLGPFESPKGICKSKSYSNNNWYMNALRDRK